MAIVLPRNYLAAVLIIRQSHSTASDRRQVVQMLRPRAILLYRLCGIVRKDVVGDRVQKRFPVYSSKVPIADRPRERGQHADAR